MPEELEIELGTEPEVETEPIETETTEPVEGETETETEESQPQGAASIWKQVKEKLKDTPELHKQVKKALHFMEDANKRLPDGVAKAVERLEMLAQLDDNPDDPEHVAGSTPIEDVISNTIAERSFWREFDNAFQAANPAILNQMIEANPESFQKLIPEAMDRFAEVNPEGFSSYISKSVYGYLNNAQIPLQLALLERVLPADSEDAGLKTVIEAFKAIKGVFSDISEMAKKPITAKAVERQQQQQDSSIDLDTRERNILHDEWLREIRPRSESAMVAEVQRIAPKTRFTAAEINSIRNAVRNEINARVRVNEGYQKKIVGFLKARNKTAYSMTVESEHKKIIPGAVKRAVDDVLAKRKAVQGKKVNPTEKTPEKREIGAATTNDNYEVIAKSPSQLGLQVDFRRGGMLGIKDGWDRAFVVGRKNPVKWKR